MSTATCSADRATWRHDHVWSVARQVALTRAEWRCAECGVADWDSIIEVHHVVPVALDGNGYRPGCQHHQDNLVVLCRLHHQMLHLAQHARIGTQLMLFVAHAA